MTETPESPDDLTDEERELFGAYNVAGDLAARCRRLREMNVSVSATVLDNIVNTLVSEFWDRGFSHSEVRRTFTGAIATMDRQAGMKGKLRRPRMVTGALLAVFSTVLLFPPVMVILAPLIAHFLYYGCYSLTADGASLRDFGVIAALGGAGLVGGIWLAQSGRNSK